MVNINRLAITGMLSFAVAFAQCTNAQEAQLTITEVSALPTVKFENWLLTNLQSVDRQRQAEGANLQDVGLKFKTFRELVVSRLEKGEFLRDTTVIGLVQYQTFYEQSKAGKAAPPIKASYETTIQLIEMLLKLTSEDSKLTAKLLSHRARLRGMVGDAKGALADYSLALPILDQGRLDADLERVTALVAAGKVAVEAGDTKKADDLFVQAYAYPWYQVRSTSHLNLLRGFHIEATSSLIELREGNLKSLQEIHIIPAVATRLKPLLDAAIKRAK